jgi:ferredoxin
MKVAVNLEACQGYACCMMEAAEVFDIDEDLGKVILLQSNPARELWARTETAARGCPAKAIRIDNE